MTFRFFLAFCVWTSLVASTPAQVTVDAWKNGKTHGLRATRTLAALADFTPAAAAPPTDAFGGWLAGPPCGPGTGFFRSQKIGDRWWLVTPEGHPFIHIGVDSVNVDSDQVSKPAFTNLFHDRNDWALQTADLLHTNGFNGTGNWSADQALAAAPRRLVYTAGVRFMSSFAQQLGLTHVGNGHTGYEDELIPVFDPAFPKYCAEYARQLAATKDDPWLLGYYSDNELQLSPHSIEHYLRRPVADPGRQELERWLGERHLETRKITETERNQWTAHVMERYYALVAGAIHQADPHHLYLGSRLTMSEAHNEALWKVAGRYVPVIAINLYGEWTPTETVRKWERWSGRPMMATEWYAKAEDSGLANTSGAGWTVKTQADRGLFYQNFALGLLESRGCVGWHWFKYADNDPANTHTDPSNRDSNKGIVTSSFQPYGDLLKAMQALNTQAYPLTTYFDRHSGN